MYFFAFFAKHYVNDTVRTQKYLKNCALYLSPLLNSKLRTCPHFAGRKFSRLTYNNARKRSHRSPKSSMGIVFPAFCSDGSRKIPIIRTCFLPKFISEAQTVAHVLFFLLSALTEAGKNRFFELVSCHASLFMLKFWTLNFGDNRLTLEPVFRVEGRSIHLMPLRFEHVKMIECVWFDMVQPNLG